MTEQVQLLDDALPALRKVWSEPTPCRTASAAGMIHPRLLAMEESALRTLPRYRRARMDSLGLCGNACPEVLRKVLKGPGKGGLGAYDSTRGSLDGWCWSMMWRQVLSDARQLGRFRREEGFPEGPEGETLMENALLADWSRREGASRITLAKEALRQAMDQFVGSAGNSPEAAFIAGVRQGYRPTLREHAEAYSVSSSTLDRRRKAAVDEVRGIALGMMESMESAVLGPMVL